MRIKWKQGGAERESPAHGWLLDVKKNKPVGSVHWVFAGSLESGGRFGADIDGTVVSVLTASDPDTGDSATFTLLDDAGGRFAIVGDELQVADGLLLDCEDADSHDITVRATDSEGLTFDSTRSSGVNDAVEA